jgi:hypothetical protein
MATSSDDTLMNATLVSALPSPMMASLNETQNNQAAPSSYQDLIKNLDIKQMSGQNMQMPASIQMQQQMPRQTQPFPQQMPQEMPQQFPPQMQMQQQMPTPDSAMELLHAQNSTYSGTMPQSAPIGEFSPGPSMDMAQGPIVNSLLPDPMFFNPPPRERKRRPHPPPPPPMVQQPNGNVLGGKIPAMDLNKIKPAILVAAIVFALLSWGAPVVAKQLTWTVDAMTGKFTSSGLIIISLLTGGIYLGISEIIRNFGNGV